MTLDTVVLTGATSGIGRATAPLLARRTSTLILHGPEPDADVAGFVDELSHAHGATVHYVQADFDDLDAVVALAARIRRLSAHVDVLVNNAGRPGPPRRTLSANGHEVTLQVNYLAAALLSELLLPSLARGRIVHVSSATHRMADLRLDDLDFEHRPYGDVAAYAQSKLAMLTHGLRCARVLAAGRHDPEVVSINPGVISTSLLHAMFAVSGASTSRGADNVVHAAESQQVRSGQYIDDGHVVAPSETASNHRIQDDLHEVTRAILAPWLRLG